ncbi:hypothetical protein [Roseivirga pacifica]|uniref:hypothetical protein n=1 Tax=Roseivirga pacifica TaxID=1267423 RepID=UPI00227A4C1C|nr:hypothetical protein [Roseivirga pacifica]
MGYMGFGMRKEVYKRKPKKSFERIKEHQKFEINTKHLPKYNVSKEYQNFRFKSLRDRKWFRLALRALLFVFVLFLVWISVIVPYRFERGKSEFESHGIVSFFDDNDFDHLLGFVSQRSDKILSIEKHWFDSGVGIWIKSPNYGGDGFFGRTSVAHNDGDKISIENDVLYLSTETENKVFDSDWSIYLTINNISDLDETVIEYLRTTRSELDEILRAVYNKGLEIENSENGSLLSFNNYYGYYSIHHQSELDTGLVVLNQIKANTYLTKRTYSY